MALSLAGLGDDETVVRIFADPEESDNVHVVEARGGAESMELAFHPAPHPDNPKTSYTAALSTVASLQRRTAWSSSGPNRAAEQDQGLSAGGRM
jgi:aspartate dehydrogenase